MFKADDAAFIRTEVRKRLSDEILRVVLAALDLGTPARLTKSGIIFAGPHGTVTSHWTGSDWRGVRNLESELRKAGVDIPRAQSRSTRTDGPKRKKKAPERFRPLPTLYEPVRETLTVTWTPEPEPEPEVVYVEERQRREPMARATSLASRRVDPRVAPLYPHLSDELREVDADLLLEALHTADSDPRRVTVEPDGSLMVWNRRAW